MNSKFTWLVLFITLSLSTFAQQIPNPGFDLWTVDPLAPNSWSTYESAFGMPLGLAKKDSVDKLTGTASVSLFSDSIPGFPQYGVFPGIVSLGSVDASMGAPEFSGIPFAFRPDTIYFG